MPRGIDQYDTAKLQGRLWTPEVLRPAAWFDAADLSTITIATGVSQWNDKSGNGRNVMQATGTKQPTYSSVGFFGRPALTFDGSDDVLLSGASLTSGTYGGAMDVCYVATKELSTGGNIFGDRSSTNVISSSWWTIDTRSYISSDGTNVSTNNTISATDEARLGLAGGIVVHQHLSGIRDKLFFGGSEITVTAGTGGSPNGGTAAFAIGDRGHTYSPQTPWTGKICEFIISLSTIIYSERVAIEGYLSWKWGIPLAADHPYANRPPLIGD